MEQYFMDALYLIFQYEILSNDYQYSINIQAVKIYHFLISYAYQN